MVYFSNTIKDYLTAFVVFVLLFVLFRVLRFVLLERISALAEKTKITFDDLLINIVKNISTFFFYFTAFFFASKTLTLPNNLNLFFDYLFATFIAYEVVKALQAFIDYFTDILSEGKDRGAQTAYHVIARFLKWILWVISALMLLSYFGVNVTALIAGFGIGGIAVAFAFKEILQDLFSYFTILLDKPIKEGDFIVFGDKKGTIESIGLKTTRLKSPDGEEIVISNATLTGGILNNFGKAKYRRVTSVISVSYDTPLEKLKEIREKIKEIVTSFPDNEFKRCYLKTFGESSLDFELVYHIKTRDYDLYVKTAESINFQILEYFEKEGIEIPYPTRTVFNKKN